MAVGTEETTIVYDYEIKEIRVYSTRLGVLNGIERRLGQQEGLRREGNFMYIPMGLCRGAEMITKLLNPEERQPMPEELKAKWKAAQG